MEEEIEYVYDDTKDLLTQCIINQLNIVKGKQELYEDAKNEIDQAVKLYNLKNESDKIAASNAQKSENDNTEKEKLKLEEKRIDNENDANKKQSRDRLIAIGVDVGIAIITTTLGYIFYSKLDARHLLYDKEGVLISKETQEITRRAMPSLFKK